MSQPLNYFDPSSNSERLPLICSEKLEQYLNQEEQLDTSDLPPQPQIPIKSFCPPIFSLIDNHVDSNDVRNDYSVKTPPLTPSSSSHNVTVNYSNTHEHAYNYMGSNSNSSLNDGNSFEFEDTSRSRNFQFPSCGSDINEDNSTRRLQRQSYTSNEEFAINNCFPATSRNDNYPSLIKLNCSSTNPELVSRHPDRTTISRNNSDTNWTSTSIDDVYTRSSRALLQRSHSPFLNDTFDFSYRPSTAHASHLSRSNSNPNFVNDSPGRQNDPPSGSQSPTSVAYYEQEREFNSYMGVFSIAKTIQENKRQKKNVYKMNKTLKCPLCENMYSSRSSRRNHVRIYHKKKLENQSSASSLQDEPQETQE
eukprot:Awhi_evm1s7818